MRLNIKDIELANISRFRAQQMGVAMLIIILFHVGLPRFDPFFGLRRMGNIGVDIFLFLSGVGLWFSWMKTPSFRHFLMRRYLRVYPAWLLIACLYYIPRFHGGDGFAWLDLVLDITINWDFWLHDELTFWYIPATMMLYLFAPAYMELIRRHPIYRWLPRTPGDFLESGAHLFYWHQHGRDGASQGYRGWRGHLDDSFALRYDVGLLRLLGTSAPW